MNASEIKVEVIDTIYNIGINVKPNRFAEIDGKFYLVPPKDMHAQACEMFRLMRDLSPEDKEIDKIEQAYVNESMAILLKEKADLLILIFKGMSDMKKAIDAQRN